MVKFLIAILAIAALGNFLYNSTPPTGEDELIYHISLPAQWLHDGHMSFPRANPNAFFPLNGEILTTGMLWLGGWKLAKVWVWITGLLMAGAIYLFGRRHAGLSSQSSLWAAAILYTMPCITSLNGTTSVDQLNLLLEILCVDCLMDWNIGCAGILAGLSLGTRPYSLAWVLAAVPVFCYEPEEWVTFLGVAAILALPWPLHNWLVTGNPFYPKAFWHSASYDRLFYAQESHYGWLAYLRLPVWLVYGGWVWGGGPSLALLVPAWNRTEWTATPFWVFSALILILTACIPMTLCNPKYFSPVFPWLAILVAKGITCNDLQPSVS